MRYYVLRCAAVVAALLAVAGPAEARCTRLAASVNDYGKEGPTNDAKANLDKYIAKWAAEHGVKSYTTGKKEVKCELFLDVGLFDEHTCRAEASVCWGGSAPAANGALPSSKPAAEPAAKPKT